MGKILSMYFVNDHLPNSNLNWDATVQPNRTYIVTSNLSLIVKKILDTHTYVPSSFE